MNKAIIGIVVAVAVIAGGWFALKSMDNKDTKSNSNSQSQASNQNSQESNQQSDENIEGSLETFRSAGKARKCTMSYSGEDGNGTGTMYTDGKGRGRMTMNLTTARGNVGESNTLVLSEKTYGWTKTDGGSFGIVYNTSTIQNNNSGSPVTSNAQNANKSFSMKCQSWNIDESLLTVPTDVTFTSAPVTP